MARHFTPFNGISVFAVNIESTIVLYNHKINLISHIRKVQSVQNADARGFSLELDEGTTSRQICASCTDYLSRDMSTSNWHVSFTRLCPARHLRTWLTSDDHTLGVRSSKTSAALVHRQIVRCSTHTQHNWRQKLCCCRATCLEQPPSVLARRRHFIVTVFGLN